MKFVEKRLDELCNIILGRTPSRSKKEYWGEGNTWVSISDLNSKYITSTREEITDLGVKKSRSRLIPKGTLLLSFKLSIGKLAFAGKDLYTNEAIAALPIINEKEIDNDYLYYVLKHIPLIGGNQAAMGQTLNKKSLSQLKIPYPKSLIDQKRIAKVLSHCEQLVAWRKESIDLLDDYLEAVFLEMFGKNNPDSENWSINTVESYAQEKKGSMRTGPFGSNLKHDEFTDEGDVKVLGIDNVVKNVFDWGKPRYITIKKYEELKRYRVYPGDVLISIMGTNGRSAVVPDDIPLSINTKHLAAITLDKSKILPFYLKYSFEYHPIILQQLSKNMKGAIMSGLNLTIIKKLKLPKPPIPVQEKFSTIVTKQRIAKEYLQKSLDELQNLYSSISQRAFKGELDLSKVEVDKVTEVDREQLKQLDRHKTEPKKVFDKKAILKQAGKRTQKIDIQNLSFQEYLGISDDSISDHDKWIFEFIGMDEFYQFLLKDKFSKQAFQYSDVVESFHSFFIEQGEIDFDHNKWKDILFKYLDAKPPLLEQEFDEEPGTIKLKLTDEAFEA